MLAICSAFLAASPAVAADAPTGASPTQPYLAAIGRPATFPSLRRVTVAVVEAGVDGKHPDLAGRIVGARRFGGGDPLFPASPHGTAVAGLISAIDGNRRGIDGIAPNARLLVAGTSFDALSIARAIRWAADRHARVINLSLAGLGPVPGYEEAVDYALARGALVVAAAGNCFDGNFTRCTPPGAEQAPAWLPHVLTVGATAADGSPSRFSIPNARWVDLAAPGELVTTLWPTRNNPYFATPDCPFVGTTGCYSTGGASDGGVGPERDLVRDGDGLGRGRDPLRRRPPPPPRAGRVVAPGNGSAGRRSATPGRGRNHRHRGGPRARARGVGSTGGLRRAERPNCRRGSNSVSQASGRRSTGTTTPSTCTG